MKWCIWAFLGILMVSGCEQFMRQLPPEPNLPEKQWTPNTQDPIGAGIDFAKVLGMLWPPLIPIATAAGGVWAGIKRLQPKLKEAETEQEKYFMGGQALALVLEDIKSENPELWKVISPKINKARMTAEEVGAAIDGFRGKA